MQHMHANDRIEEARRIMNICNACRYCEGHCAVFPAMEQRLGFAARDLSYLANLCHNCRSCYHHCQYTEPHEFAVNVPKTFAVLRRQSYTEHVRPRMMARLFGIRWQWHIAWLIVAALTLVGFTAVNHQYLDFFGVYSNAFYGVLSHFEMTLLFSIIALLVLWVLLTSIVRYWRYLGLSVQVSSQAELRRAVADTLTLKYLTGGSKDGCTYPGEEPSNLRRYFHHMTFYGFLLCFVATTAATVLHFVFAQPAPYGYWSLPKLFGVPGGLALICGSSGLLWLKHKADVRPGDALSSRMDSSFLVMLWLTALSGLVLMLLKATVLMASLLVFHLGAVVVLFITMPYGKFIHGFFHLVALIKYAREQSQEMNKGV